MANARSENPYKKIVHNYIGGVISGKITACRWVRLACKRHLRDLKYGYQRGLWFDEQAATKVIEFFGFLKHSKGEWAGQTIKLEPWQMFFLWVLFGWKRDDGTRRFRTCYLEVARKNGKSTIAAGIGLFLLIADNEPGAEIYSAATKMDQARITHKEAIRMVDSSAPLKQRLTIVRDNISISRTASKYEPLGRDSKSMDGLNVHGAIIDELHAHPTGELWDVLETATGSRRQPLMFSISTAGMNRQSICFQFNQMTKQILEGVLDDDSWFGMIFTLDEADMEEDKDNPDAQPGWMNEDNWIKANPNLGVSKKLDQMRRLCKRAQNMPARLAAFLQKELNIWVSSSNAWLDVAKWKNCQMVYDEESLKGRKCYAGLDLSSKIDLTALILVFPPVEEGEPKKILSRFWIPEENVYKRVHEDRVPYDVWIREGWIRATDGNVIDYERIIDQVLDDAKAFEMIECAYDPWSAQGTANKLNEKGITMVEFRQGYRSFSEPMKDTEAEILSRQIAHNGNPVLTWNMSNLVATKDPAGNLKPDKEKSREKIDGGVATIMANGRTLVHAEEDKPSVYEERGILTL